MHRLWRLATRSWSASPGRTFASLVSLALGVGSVVVITSVYETARATVEHEVLHRWLGASHVSIHPLGAHWGTIPESDDLAARLRRLPNVEHISVRLHRRMRLYWGEGTEVDAVGFDINAEQHFRTWPQLEGRLPLSGESGVALVEQQLARRGDFGLGDTVWLSGRQGGKRRRLEVIGLFDGQRIGDFQSPYVYLGIGDLRALTGSAAHASVIDIILADSSPTALQAAGAAVTAVLQEKGLAYKCRVSTSEVRQLLLDEADRVARFSLMLVAFIALLTAFFIIVTTMSMSLFERRAAFGTLRCVGMTRYQLAALVLMELLPIGIAGTLAGAAGGAGAVRIIEYFASQEVRVSLTISSWGVGMASASGIMTTVFTAALLVVLVVRVTPLEAIRVHARSARIIVCYVCGVVGLLLIGTHEFMIQEPDATMWLNRVFASSGMAALYFGYVLLTPALVVVLGRPIARGVSHLLGLRGGLASKQLQRAPWRAAGTCWTLLVGLSLMVYLALATDSILNLYDFSGRLPDTFLWAQEFVPNSTLSSIQALPGVEDTTVLADVDCKILNADAKRDSLTGAFVGAVLGNLTRPVFVAGDVERITEMVHVTFDEGTREEALEKMHRGGYVLIPSQTAKNKGLHVGDRVRIGMHEREAEFEIAGVVQSPILDLTVTAFQAHSYFQFAAAAVVFGTHEDLHDKFELDVFTMVMADLDLGDAPPPSAFRADHPPAIENQCTAARLYQSFAADVPSESSLYESVRADLASYLDGGCAGRLRGASASTVARLNHALRRCAWRWDKESPEERWSNFREQLVLVRISDAVGVDSPIMGSIRRMKDINGTALRRAGMVLTWLPSIILVVAAIGIGNLMMVGVQVRARQLAILRAMGALKSQITRLILTESVALALVGSICGIALGIHQTMSDNRVVGALTGIQPPVTIPWATLTAATLFTTVVCLVAGWMPARVAARSNVLDALHAN